MKTKEKKEQNDRFEKVYEQGFLATMEIWADTQTGVQYLVHTAGSGVAMTVLVDAEGKPILYRRTPETPEY